MKSKDWKLRLKLLLLTVRLEEYTDTFNEVVSLFESFLQESLAEQEREFKQDIEGAYKNGERKGYKLAVNRLENNPDCKLPHIEKSYYIKKYNIDEKDNEE